MRRKQSWRKRMTDGALRNQMEGLILDRSSVTVKASGLIFHSAVSTTGPDRELLLG